MIVLDLDDFDALVQRVSRDAADAMLRDLGGLLHSQVRKEDLACRCGTHRFAIILPQGSLAAARERAESLRDLIRRLEVKEPGQPAVEITASISVAAYPDHSRTIDELLRVAAEALSHARAAGGDCVLEGLRT
jgi:diguanylate cyclase (GGDEF)-like protein